MRFKCIERRLPTPNSRINQPNPTSSTLRVRLLFLLWHLLTRLDASPPSAIDLDEGRVSQKEAPFLSLLALPHLWLGDPDPRVLGFNLVLDFRSVLSSRSLFCFGAFDQFALYELNWAKAYGPTILSKVLRIFIEFLKNLDEPVTVSLQYPHISPSYDPYLMVRFA